MKCRRFTKFFSSIALAIALLLAPRVVPPAVAASPERRATDARATDETVLLGEILPEARIKVVAEISGVVRTLTVREGDRVTAGQVIATIDDREPRLAVDGAKAMLALADARLRAAEKGARTQEQAMAESNLKAAETDAAASEADFARVSSVYAKGGVDRRTLDRARTQRDASAARLRNARETLGLVKEGPREEDRDALRAQVDQARATLSLAELRLEKTRIASPVAGAIVERFIDPGAYVQGGGGGGNGGGGGAVATIIADDVVRVLVRVPERLIALIRPGLRARVRVIALPGRAFQGEFARVNPDVHPESRNGLAEISLPNAEHLLRPGMLAEIRLVLPRETAEAERSSHGRD